MTFFFLASASRTMGPETRWLLNPETTAGAVQSLDNYDISGDGVKDLIVGRHDGSIEVYSYDEGDETEPILKYSHVRYRCIFVSTKKRAKRAESMIFRKFFNTDSEDFDNINFCAKNLM